MSEHPTKADRCRVELQLYSGYNRVGLLKTHFIKYFENNSIGLTLEGKIFTERAIEAMLFPHDLSLKTVNGHFTYKKLEIRGYSVISASPSQSHVSIYLVAHETEQNPNLEPHVLLPIMMSIESDKGGLK